MTAYFIALLAYCLVLKYKPATRLLEHFYGTCYVIRYKDCYDYPHKIRVWCHDPREAGLVALIFKKMEDETPDLIRNMQFTPKNGT
jgi:hypothetical protein